MTEDVTDYSTAAPLYQAEGWTGILPLPPNKKIPPPKGTTGYDGYYPSGPDIAEWIANNSGGNLALRLPNTVVGIDVDDYKSKQGGKTLAEAERRWGPLPDSIRSTARDDGISGIRLFSIDAGMEFETILTFPEMGLGDIEIIQYFHRYCVAWPSVHPDTGRRYMWLDGNDNWRDIPSAYSLPRLPDRWIEGLSRKVAAQKLTGTTDVAAALIAIPQGQMSMAVQDTLKKAITEITTAGATRHDTTLKNVLRLLRRAEEGETGVLDALEELRGVFVKLVTKDGSRSVEDARAEFDRMVEGQRGHGLIAETPSVQALIGAGPKKPEALAYDGYVNTTLAQIAHEVHADTTALRGQLASVAEAEPEDNALIWELMGEPPPPPIAPEPAFRTSWGETDVLGALLGTWEPVVPTELARLDGALLLYPGRVNALVGEPESGKSWIIQLACAQAMALGRNIVYIDFEDSLHSMIDRFRHLSVPDDIIGRHLTYIQPDSALGPDEQEELYRSLERRLPAITVVDGVNAAMTILGLDLEKNKDATTFHQYLLAPLTRNNSAVVTIDHIPKNRMGQGGFAIGAQAKKAMVDGAMIGVQSKEPFGKGRLGYSEMLVMKDKPGAVRALAERRGNIDYLATVTLDARQSGTVRVVLAFDTQAQEQQGPSKKDLGLMSRMERISAFIEQYDAENKGVSLRKIIDGVGGGKGEATGAVNVLIDKGHLRVEKVGRSNLHFLERPYKVSAEDLRSASGVDPDSLLGL